MLCCFSLLSPFITFQISNHTLIALLVHLAGGNKFPPTDAHNLDYVSTYVVL